MAWYLRKSVSIGPVRFNLSKGGIGTSVGIKGFRVGVRPNGKSYVHAGRYGLYYRQELGNTNRSNERDFTPQTPLEPPKHSDTVEYKTASSQELSPQSRKEMLDRLNQSYKSVRLDYLCGVVAVLPSYMSFQANMIAGLIVSAIGLIAFILVARWESKRRTVVINYDFEDNDGASFKKIIQSFNVLASNRKVWSLIDTRNIYGTHESKLNAGAANLINRSDAQIGESKPPWVETNIDVPVIKTRGQSLYMMPDGIFVYDNKGVGFVEYNDIQVNVGTTRFIENSPPTDANVVDKTWKHPNINGGPDKRFKNNYQIPVCLYGELRVKSNSGMNIYLMTSKEDAPHKFSSEFSSICRS